MFETKLLDLGTNLIQANARLEQLMGEAWDVLGFHINVTGHYIVLVRREALPNPEPEPEPEVVEEKPRRGRKPKPQTVES